MLPRKCQFAPLQGGGERFRLQTESILATEQDNYIEHKISSPFLVPGKVILAQETKVGHWLHSH